MRTTIELDDDLLKQLREQAFRTRIQLRRVVNAALRKAVEGERSPRRQPYHCPTFAMGQPVAPGIDLDKALRLAGALEDAEIARKLELRK